MIRSIRISLMVFTIFTFANAQSDGQALRLSFEVLSNSKVGFAGSSNINSFYCNTAAVNGLGSGVWMSDSAGPTKYSAQVTLTASSLDCGSGRMNRDLYKALDADKNPLIDYQLLDILSISEIESEHSFEVQTDGVMSVAGTSLQVNIVFKVVAIGGNRYSVRGSKELSMRDFDIDPPKALFGLIRAKEKLIVEFDIVVKATE